MSGWSMLTLWVSLDCVKLENEQSDDGSDRRFWVVFVLLLVISFCCCDDRQIPPMKTAIIWVLKSSCFFDEKCMSVDISRT